MTDLPEKPDYGEFQTAEWNEDYGFWVVRDLTEAELEIKFPPPPPPAPPTLLEYAATRRWQVETGGITVGGVPIYTDDRSKLMLTGARIRAEANPDATEKWAAADGSIYTLTSAQIIAMSDAVAAHVSACFGLFADILDDITSETITEHSQIDAAFDALNKEY